MSDSNSGLYDYVESSSSEKLTASNYNEVDALVFAEMSYFKFENVYSQDGAEYISGDNGTAYSYNPGEESVSVSQYARDILNYNSTHYNEIPEKSRLSDDQIALLQEISTSQRYSDCQMHDFACADTNDSQWAAYTVDIDQSGTSVIAMRGTDGTTLGWTEDLNLAYDINGTNAQNLSCEYLEKCTSDSIYMTGHSKGGSDVTSAYVLADESTRDRVVQINNYDGPGMNSEMKWLNHEAYSELDDKLYNYYPKDSVIGLLLRDNPGQNTFIDSELRADFANYGPFGEHDPFSLIINGNEFSETSQTLLSDYINSSLDFTVACLSQPERYMLASAVEWMGVPSIIAGKYDEISYFVTDEETRNFIDNVDFLNLLSDEDIEKFSPGLAKFATITRGIRCFVLMPKPMKDALAKTVVCFAAGSVVFWAKELGERIVEEVAKKIESIVNYYHKFADFFNDTKADIKSAVLDFCENLKSDANDFLSAFVESFPNIFNGLFVVQAADGIVGKANFIVNIDSLLTEAEDLINYSNMIEQYHETLKSIQSGLGITLAAYVFVSMTKAKNALSGECSKCLQLGQKLEDIASTYSLHESNICSNVSS